MALSREEEVDLTLQKNPSGVESALLYAKAWSKYIKDLLTWVEKRLAMGEALRRGSRVTDQGFWAFMSDGFGLLPYQWSVSIYFLF